MIRDKSSVKKTHNRSKYSTLDLQNNKQKGEMQMGCEAVVERCKYLMCVEDVGRIKVSEDRIQIDLHGMTRAEAKRSIKNIIALSPIAFTLDVIHGYNRGTVIKDMIQEEELSSRVYHKWLAPGNPGRTFIEVAARCA